MTTHYPRTPGNAPFGDRLPKPPSWLSIAGYLLCTLAGAILGCLICLWVNEHYKPKLNTVRATGVARYSDSIGFTALYWQHGMIRAGIEKCSSATLYNLQEVDSITVKAVKLWDKY